jgi:3-oxoacyl-[acyl-carrier-protein] synthase-1
MQPLAITAYTLTSALGRGVSETYRGLEEGATGLGPNDFAPGLCTYIGRVTGLETCPMPAAYRIYDCRNNSLARIALEQDDFLSHVSRARGHYGAGRIAVIVGTSTGGMEATEQAYRRRSADGGLPSDFHFLTANNIHSLGLFVQTYTGLRGPCQTLSTACSSSAKAFASAARMIEAGIVDAALVGGVDSLCLSTLFGFNALELLASEPCRPCDAERAGLSLGEAGGFALLERPGPNTHDAPRLLGYGESSDAYHMSAPHPEGRGAILAMREALACAGLDPADIDYINMHGTASPMNDRVEDTAIAEIFGGHIPIGSTKGATGHTLGAAGITEALVCLLALAHGFMPGTPNTRRIDPGFSSTVLLQGTRRPLRHILSNSFGFGGNNCSLLFAS